LLFECVVVQVELPIGKETEAYGSILSYLETLQDNPQDVIKNILTFYQAINAPFVNESLAKSSLHPLSDPYDVHPQFVSTACWFDSIIKILIIMGFVDQTKQKNEKAHNKGKVLPYALQSVGPGADAGVQAISPQVTISHPPDGRLPLLSTRPAFYIRKHSPDDATPN